MEEICLISAEHTFFSRWPRLNQVATALIRHEARSLARKYPNAKWTGLVSAPVFDALPGEKKAAVHAHSEFHYPYTEKLDNRELHTLADALDARARAFGEDGGLVWRGKSVFRVGETRWITQLMMGYAAYAEMIADVLEKNPNARLLPFSGNSFHERCARQIAANRSLLISEPRIGQRLLGWSLKAFQRGNVRIAKGYAEILGDWRRYAAPTRALLKPGKKVGPRVAFVAYKDRTLRRVEALAPRLLRESGGDVWVISLYSGLAGEARSTVERLQKLGVKIAWASDAVSGDDVENIVKTVRARTAVTRSDFFSDRFHLNYGGVDLFPEVKHHVEELIDGASPVTAVTCEAADRILETLAPDLVVNFEEWELNRALSLTARELGIKTLAMYCISPDLNTGLVRRLPDRLAAAGKFLADAYTSKAQWSADEVEIIGDPLADRLATIDRVEAKHRLVAEHGLDPRLPVVLLVGIYADALINAEDLRAAYAATLRATEAAGGQLVFKAHPQDDLSQVTRVFREISGDKMPVIVQHADLIQLAAGCDLGVVIMTSATSQLMVAGTPVVSIQPPRAAETIELSHAYRRDAGMPVVFLGDDAAPMFRRALTDEVERARMVKHGEEYAARHMGPLDGHSVERACALIMRLSR